MIDSILEQKADTGLFLASRIEGLSMPDRDQESTDPAAADQAYSSASRWLLTQTRDTKKFYILFQENMSYGFRRNLLGLKGLAVAICLGGAVLSTAAIAYAYFTAHQIPRDEIVVMTAVAWLSALWWIFDAEALAGEDG
jgi:hypothetical protein